MNNKKIVYIDMDDTMCHYTPAHRAIKTKQNPFPQSEAGFWLGLEPIDLAIESVNKLRESHEYDPYVLTAPSVRNPASYAEKRIWVENYFDYEFCMKLIICSNKALLKGAFLIDDYDSGKGQEGFDGELIHFGSNAYPGWKEVMQKLGIPLN